MKITFKESTANNLNLNYKYLSKSNILTKILQNRNWTITIEIILTKYKKQIWHINSKFR